MLERTVNYCCADPFAAEHQWADKETSMVEGLGSFKTMGPFWASLRCGKASEDLAVAGMGFYNVQKYPSHLLFSSMSTTLSPHTKEPPGIPLIHHQHFLDIEPAVLPIMRLGSQGYGSSSPLTRLSGPRE